MKVRRQKPTEQNSVVSRWFGQTAHYAVAAIPSHPNLALSLIAGRATDPNDQIVTCRPDVCVYPTKLGKDEFVLICCDGVWDVMGSQEAVDFVHETMDLPDVDTLDKCMTMLLQKCLEKGSQDNMTAAIIALPGYCRDHNYFRKKSSGICTVS
jgi:serine/threonine protein phosphatase PrpC